jgi:mRNA interferase HicA
VWRTGLYGTLAGDVARTRRRCRFGDHCAGATARSDRLALYTFTCTVNSVKRRELERRLRTAGWNLIRHGGNHDIWGAESGEEREAVPRHDEISEQLAKKILRKAEGKQP